MSKSIGEIVDLIQLATQKDQAWVAKSIHYSRGRLHEVIKEEKEGKDNKKVMALLLEKHEALIKEKIKQLCLEWIFSSDSEEQNSAISS